MADKIFDIKVTRINAQLRLLIDLCSDLLAKTSDKSAWDIKYIRNRVDEAKAIVAVARAVEALVNARVPKTGV